MFKPFLIKFQFILIIFSISSFLSCNDLDFIHKKEIHYEHTIQQDINNLTINTKNALVKIVIGNDNKYYNGFILSTKGHVLSIIENLNSSGSIYVIYKDRIFKTKILNYDEKSNLILLKMVCNYDYVFNYYLIINNSPESFKNGMLSLFFENTYSDCFNPHMVYINIVKNGIGMESNLSPYFMINSIHKCNLSGCPLITMGGKVIGLSVKNTKDKFHHNYNNIYFINYNEINEFLLNIFN
jgi:hypothetical protein